MNCEDLAMKQHVTLLVVIFIAAYIVSMGFVATLIIRRKGKF